MTHTITFAEARDALAEGRPVILPTDTVYGLGVAVGPAEGPGELFRLKGRDEGKPVAWLVADATAPASPPTPASWRRACGPAPSLL